MVHIPGFTIEELLIAEGQVSVFNAVRRKDKLPVLMKTAPLGARGAGRMFQEELALLRKLQTRGVIEVLDLIRHDEYACLVYKRKHWIPLKDFLGDPDQEPAVFLKIAVQLAAALGDIHNRGVIHKNIKSLNIFIEEENLEVTVAGFDLAIPAQREMKKYYRPEMIKRSLHYTSPEQTGRMDRGIDFRSDLYSLGVTLYELGAGRLPFVAEPLELIHMHLAVAPKPPHLINKNLPEQLGRIILKLMEKDPDKRYQTAGGLHADLVTCRHQLEEGGALEWFELGAREVPTTLSLSTRTYGRREELQTLKEAFRNAYRGETELVMISGVPGVGKTSLVKALRQSLVNDRIPFLKGAFERFQTNMPYAGLAQAITAWLEQVLAGSDEELANWREVLTEAMGSYADIAAEVVPKIDLLINTEETTDSYYGIDVHQRAGLAMQRLIRGIADQVPLMLSLDDVQWADAASLQLIDNLLGAGPPTSLLLILSYRKAALHTDHPVHDMMHRHSDSMRHIELKPWTLDNLNDFLADTVERSPVETRLLAELIQRKTGGNPQFVRQYLRHIYSSGLIYFEIGGGWQWDLQAIESAEIPDDIVGIMTEKLARLPTRTRNILKLAGCVGRQFDPATLSAISKLSEEEVALDLYTLTFEGLIAPQGNLYRFSHNRIFEAAVGLLSEEERATLHFKIGSLILDRCVDETLQRDIFEIVDHLNHGRPESLTKEMRVRLAKLNLRAGRKAMESAAHPSASVYFETGLTLAASSATWEQNYDLLFSLNLELAQTHFQNGDLSGTADGLRALLKEKLKEQDYARVVSRMIGLYNLTGQPIRGLRIGVEGLQKLGANFSLHLSKTRFRYQFLKTMWLARNKRGDRLAALPEAQSTVFRSRMRILTEMVMPAYFCSSRFLGFLILHMAEQVFKHGHHTYSPLALGLFSCALVQSGGEPEQCRNMTAIADSLQQRFGNKRFAHRLLFYKHYYVGAWLSPYAECATQLADNARRAYEVGDLQFAAYSSAVQWHLRFLSNGHLADLINEAEKHVAQVEQAGFHDLKHGNIILANIAGYLHNDQRRRIMDKRSPGDPFGLEELKDRHVQLPFHFVTPHAAMALYLFGKYRESYALSTRVMPLIAKVTLGGQNAMENRFWLGMAAAALFPDAKGPERAGYLKQVNTAIRTYSKAARRCRHNFSLREQLLQAELARMTGKTADAFHCYARAAEQIAREGIISLRGLVEERRATLAMTEGFPTDAAHYIGGSLSAYKAWGALAKAAQVRALYGTYLRDKHRWEGTSEPTHGDRAADLLVKSVLDLETVLQSSLAISQEVQLTKVLERVMASAMENAGAKRGALLLKRGVGLWVEGESNIDGNFSRVVQDKPVGEGAPLPMSVIKYAKRTLETVVLGDASREGLFKNDPYIMATNARSLLVLPIVHQNKMVGMLYLENNLVGNAFSEERIEILQLISAQAAVSIDNANLYDQLSQLNRDLEVGVEERTRELQAANRQLTQEIQDRIKTQEQLVETQSKLLEAARRAGMTEVAIGVLHNVGNVLNSITISVDSLNEGLNNSKLPQLDRVIELITNPDLDLNHFFTEDPRGKIFPQFMEKLAGHLNKEHGKYREEVMRMTTNLSHVIEVIRAQQDHAKMRAVLEPIEPQELLDQAVKISGLALPEKNVTIVREFENMPSYLVEKHKVLQIIINLIKNAGQSMAKSNKKSLLTVALKRGPEGHVVFTVTDNGIGISKKQLTEIFGYGYTTRKDGHGFGLHNAANAATEMGGSLKAFSDGKDQGATFVLSLPLRENTTGLAMDIQQAGV